MASIDKEVYETDIKIASGGIGLTEGMKLRE